MSISRITKVEVLQDISPIIKKGDILELHDGYFLKKPYRKFQKIKNKVGKETFNTPNGYPKELVLSEGMRSYYKPLV